MVILQTTIACRFVITFITLSGNLLHSFSEILPGFCRVCRSYWDKINNAASNLKWMTRKKITNTCASKEAGRGT